MVIMKPNIGIIDRIVRIIVAVVLAIVAGMYGIWWLFIFVAVLLGTAIIGWCGLYQALGISTKKK
jgi:hypothetical protein